MRNGNILLVCAALIGLTGCGVTSGLNSPIDMVKTGMLPGYNATTVGKAFEGTFQNAQWTSFVSSKGATVVQLNGTIKNREIGKIMPNALMPLISDPQNCGNDMNCLLALDVPVTFQFTVAANKRSFEITSYDETPFQFQLVGSSGFVRRASASLNHILAFIYN
jgi:hypothetical protein